MSTEANPLVGSGPDAGLSTTIGDPDSVTSLPTGEPESSEGNTPEPEGEVETQPEAGAEGTEGQTKEDGRMIPSWIRSMKEANPEGYKAAKSAFFNLKERETVHPTVQAAREEHDLVQSLGGREGATRLQEDNVFFKEAANQFLKGDPAFIKDLFEEDPIAAALHVAPMLEEFKTRDFEGYKSTIARIWENDFKRLNFAPALQDLLGAVQSGDKATAAQIVQSIQQWHDSILDVAKRAEDPRVKSLLAERNSRQESEQRTQHEEFLKTYRTETANEVVTEGSKIFDSFFRNTKLDAEDRKDLLADSLKLASNAILADKAFNEQREAHLKRGDSHSAKQMTKARFAREMTEAVKRVARRYGVASGKPAQSSTTQQQRQPGTNGQQHQPPAGFVAVNARPEPEQINRRLTSDSMIISKRAILNDGRKVDWSKLK